MKRVLRYGFSILSIFTMLTIPVHSQSKTGYPRLMQGPMVGTVTPTEIHIWLRTSGAYNVRIEYSTNPAFFNPEKSYPVRPLKKNDYTDVIILKNLRPNTTYYYHVLVEEKSDPYLQRYKPFCTKTAPETGSKTNFKIAYGSCPRFQRDRVQPIWNAVFQVKPDLFFWGGDNVYSDALDTDILQEEYRRQRDVHSLQPVLRSIPNLAFWDDHDFGLNNHDRTNPIKEKALIIFKQYWANPAYGLAKVPGVFFKYSYGAVDFFILDVRYYRDPNIAPDIPSKTMLGKEQLKWLKSELKQSNAIFKLIFSGSGWSTAKGQGGDSWAAYLHERNSLFNYIRDEKIEGVVLLSGDTHVGELNLIPWSEHGGYDLYDLCSSPLAQPAGKSWLKRQPEQRVRLPYFSTSNFGLVEFFLTGEQLLRFNLIDIEGREVWKPLVLSASELKNGVKSWPEKVHGIE